jgi:hypothetical protein
MLKYFVPALAVSVIPVIAVVDVTVVLDVVVVLEEDEVVVRDVVDPAVADVDPAGGLDVVLTCGGAN